jgi:hypothetical protein
MHRVMIGVPSLDTWNAEFGIAFGRLLIYASRQPFAGEPLDVALGYARGSILPDNRNRLLRGAVEGGAGHLLFLDADMDFPPDTLHRLLAHRREVVAANYVKRRLPAVPLARRAGRPIVSEPGQHGLEAVDSVGAGVMLIDVTVLSRIQPPAFAFIEAPGRPGAFLGEDIFFCRKLAAAGIPVHIDHDLSREVSHIGSFHYRMSQVEPGPG